MKSKKIIKSHKTITYWMEGLRESVSREPRDLCSNAEDNQLLWDWGDRLYNLKLEINKFYAPKIGDAIISENG